MLYVLEIEKFHYREKLLIDEWLLSDKDLHIIRDHCYHDKAYYGRNVLR